MATVYRRETKWYAKVKLPAGHRDFKPGKPPWRNYPTSFGAARGAPRVTGTYIHNDLDHLRAELARLQYLEP